MDDYNHLITEGQKYISGFYLEKKRLKPQKVLPILSIPKKSVYFYPKSIIYPFVNFQEKPKYKKECFYQPVTTVMYFVSYKTTEWLLLCSLKNLTWDRLNNCFWYYNINHFCSSVIVPFYLYSSILFLRHWIMLDCSHKVATTNLLLFWSAYTSTILLITFL